MTNTYPNTKQPLPISSESIQSSLAAILEKVNQMNRKYEYFFSQFETAANGYIISNFAPKKYNGNDAALERRFRGTTIHTVPDEYETAYREDAHVDCPDVEVVSNETRAMHNVGLAGLTFFVPEREHISRPERGTRPRNSGRGPFVVEQIRCYLCKRLAKKRRW
ncbi:hypothetical protein CASFOL_034631 [Castilleja foliolosa]|uniref:Uncharacterized protein n=1 Tax=Castilleja foliolosa TaxID=1961234 RepID=A0ABD3BRI2_9LAMI